MASAKTWITPKQARDALETGTGKGIRVAILDSGVEFDHPALADAKIIDRLVVNDTDDGPIVVEDDKGDAFGHGTAIARIIHETAPEVELGSFKVMQPAVDGQTSGKASLVEEAVKEAIRRDYHIINCSFGTPARSVVFRYFKNWIDKAYLNDVHVVTACNNANYARPEWPAHFASVIAVNMGTIEGEHLHYRPGQLVEFFAHGDRVRVPWLDKSWKTVTGSSYAAPRVSGFVARILSKYPELSAPFVKAVLREVAEPWSDEVAGENVWL